MEVHDHGLAKAIAHVWESWKASSSSIIQIEAQKAFLKSIQLVRLLVLSIFALWLLGGLMLMVLAMGHASVILFLPDDKKIIGTLVMTVVDMGMIFVLGSYFLSEKKWVNYSKHYGWFEHENEQACLKNKRGEYESAK